VVVYLSRLMMGWKYCNQSADENSHHLRGVACVEMPIELTVE